MRGKKANHIVVQKMISYCNEIQQILKKHDYKKYEFEKDSEFQFACGMCILQLGELVGKLSDEFIRQHSNIPWRQIRGMRNIYAHEYDIIDNDTVWEAITEDIPELKNLLQNVLNELNNDFNKIQHPSKKQP